MSMLKQVGASGVLLGVGSSAFAAVPTEVTTALTEAQTDVTTIGGTVLLIAVAAYAIRWLIAQVV